MKSVCALLLAAALLLPAAPARATTPAPGIQVVVRNGRTVVFNGISDGRGRFATGPLEPGIYTFELRVPQHITTPARYFLALSGARPVGEPMIGPAVALSMDAQVRTAGSVRGQVTARRINIVPAQSTTSAATPSASPATRTVSPVAPGAGTLSPLTPRPVGYQPRMINGRPHIWMPIAPGSALGRWIPKAGTPPTRR